MARCYVCDIKTSKMCNACQTVYYCSKFCQKTDWNDGHKQACKGSLESPKEIKTLNRMPKSKIKFELTTHEEIDVVGFEAMLRIKFDGLAQSNMEELQAIKEERKRLKNRIGRYAWPSKETVDSFILDGNVDRIQDQVIVLGSFGSVLEQVQLYNHDLMKMLYECLGRANDLVKVDGRIRRLAWQFKKHGEKVALQDGIFFLPLAVISGADNLPIVGPARRKSAYKSLLFHFLILKYFTIDRFLRKLYVRSVPRDAFGTAILNEMDHPNAINEARITLSTMIDYAWNNVGEWIQIPRI